MIKELKITKIIQALLDKQDITQKDILAIKKLDLKEKEIDNIDDLRLFENLESVELFNNPIRDYSPLNSLKKLTSLNIGPFLENADITSLKQLESIKEIFLLKHADLSIISDWTGLESLWSCYVKREDISAISKLSNLRRIYFFDNSNIKDISVFANMPLLIGVDFEYNKVENLSPLRNCAQLESLLIGGNRIHDLSPLADLSKLTFLKMCDNPVEDFTPLLGLPLKNLEIDECPISNLDVISQITSIQRLVIEKTAIRDIRPLLNLFDLKELEIQNMYIDDKQINAIKEKFPNCIVK